MLLAATHTAVICPMCFAFVALRYRVVSRRVSVLAPAVAAQAPVYSPALFLSPSNPPSRTVLPSMGRWAHGNPEGVPLPGSAGVSLLHEQ